MGKNKNSLISFKFISLFQIPIGTFQIPFLVHPASSFLLNPNGKIHYERTYCLEPYELCSKSQWESSELDMEHFLNQNFGGFKPQREKSKLFTLYKFYRENEQFQIPMGTFSTSTRLSSPKIFKVSNPNGKVLH